MGVRVCVMVYAIDEIPWEKMQTHQIMRGDTNQWSPADVLLNR